jgi:integral membrane protein
MKTTLGRLRVTGRAEGISFLLLLGVAMPLKYLAGYPGAVRLVGMAHGVLFILYVILALQAAWVHRWNWQRTGWVLLASLLPAGPFLVESRILHSTPKPVALPVG